LAQASWHKSCGSAQHPEYGQMFDFLCGLVDSFDDGHGGLHKPSVHGAHANRTLVPGSVSYLHERPVASPQAERLGGVPRCYTRLPEDEQSKALRALLPGGSLSGVPTTQHEFQGGHPGDGRAEQLEAFVQPRPVNLGREHLRESHCHDLEMRGRRGISAERGGRAPELPAHLDWQGTSNGSSNSQTQRWQMGSSSCLELSVPAPPPPHWPRRGSDADLAPRASRETANADRALPGYRADSSGLIGSGHSGQYGGRPFAAPSQWYQ